jgi:acyl-CoA thioester hydrolase
MARITFEESVYTYQIDFAGHVSNIVYIQWLENARLRLLEAAGVPAHQLAREKGLVAILARTEIRYLLPLYMGDRVRVEAWISRLRRASATLEIHFYRGSELVATAQQDGLFVDTQTQKPARISAELRERFREFVETAG